MSPTTRHHPISRTLALALLCTAAVTGPVAAAPAERPDAAVVARIVDEGLNRSEVMPTASELMDGIGPRLTNSENVRKAQAWAMDRVRGYGLSNVHLEPFYFGLGWNLIASRPAWHPRDTFP